MILVKSGPQQATIVVREVPSLPGGSWVTRPLVTPMPSGRLRKPASVCRDFISLAFGGVS